MRQNTLRRFGLAAATVAAMAGPAAACTVDLPFSNGSSALNASVRTFLDGFAANNAGNTVTLTGYASPDGSAAANAALSAQRATNVSNYLTQASNGSINIASQGVGESAEIGRAVRLQARRCTLPNGQQLAGSGAGAGGALGAAGALSPAALAGLAIGALALGGALAAGGDNNNNGTTTTGSTGSTGTTGTSGTN